MSRDDSKDLQHGNERLDPRDCSASHARNEHQHIHAHKTRTQIRKIVTHCLFDDNENVRT